ncbi:hypothetical protein DVK02_12905 [Halobellus sp. Atlit-31R]|nr:hypothetical protein DVK02_12905 [Halobellus sp. Atlit-31R]
MSSNYWKDRVDPDAERLKTTRPALDVFDRDQDRLLYEGDRRREPQIEPLGDGFSSYWMLLTWYQAAGVRTLGHVETVLPPDRIMPESGVTRHLLRPTENDESAYVRRRLVERLDSVCDLAYRQFRERAQERVDDGESQRGTPADPSEERNPLMRPAFRKLDQGQVGALEDLWRGFHDPTKRGDLDREALGRWVRSLTTVTNGAKPDGFLDEIIASEALLETMARRGDAAVLNRYRFAVAFVLPAFLDGARTLNGGEATKTESKSHGAFSS